MYKLKVERHDYWGAYLIPNWHVYRRYNDFVKLDKKIRQNYPDITLELLPGKKWIGDNFNPLFLGKRINGLTSYLKGIMNHHQIQGFMK